MDDVPPAEQDAPIRVSEKITYTTESQFSYVWTISAEDLHCMSEFHVFHSSPRFTTSAEDVWCLKFRDHDQCYMLHLCLLSTGKSQIEATYEFSIINSDKRKIFRKPRSEICMFSPAIGKDEHGLRDFITYAEIYRSEGIIIAGRETFDVLCEITVVSESYTVDIPKSCNDVPFNLPRCQIIEDVRRLFTKQELSDVTINICDRQVPAHRTILAMRSPVFAAMFEHEMTEKKESQVNIIDVDFEIFQEVLRFIYTGRVKNIEKINDKLLSAANKYQLDRLKVMCEESLRLTLAVENAAEMLILADLYDARNLKTRTALYIAENLAQVMGTESYQSMIRSHPILMHELLRASVMKTEFRAGKSTVNQL